MSEHFDVLVQPHLYEKYILLRLRLVDGAQNIMAFLTIFAGDAQQVVWERNYTNKYHIFS